MKADAVLKIRAELDEVVQSNVGVVPHTLTPLYYTSPDFVEIEQQKLFREGWACLGHIGEIPEKGDYFSTDIAEEPILVIRQRDGTVAALSNVCRHRGNLLAEGAGNKSRFTCSYHAWTYDETGQLRSAPHMDRVPGFSKETVCLPRFNTEVWNGFIYVNLNGNAGPLADDLQDLQAIIANYALQDRIIVHSEEDVWNTNWKCLAENFMEGYHLTPTHARTLHPITPTDLCVKMPFSERFTGYWSKYSPTWPDRKPYPPGLTEEECRQSPLFWVPPNHVVGLATNNCVYMCMRPKGPDQVAIRWGVLSTVPANDPIAQDYVRLCHDFNAEDKAKLESVQRGLKSRFVSRSPLAPADFEGTIWDIFRFIGQRLGQNS